MGPLRLRLLEQESNSVDWGSSTEVDYPKVSGDAIERSVIGLKRDILTAINFARCLPKAPCPSH